MQRSYIDGPFGQIHLRHWNATEQCNTPVLCLPPSPYSSVAYTTFAPLIAADRAVIAVDYPGYGNSDATFNSATIADYATAIHAVISNLSAQRPVNLLGFHTGCLVAVETALLYPQCVNRLILIDVPYFTEDARAQLLEKTAAPTPLKPELSMLEAAWNFSVAGRLDYLSLERAYQLFIDQASSGEGMNAAFRAAFTYPCEERFAEIDTPTQLIATKSSLLETTRAAAAAFPRASLLEIPEVTRAVLELGAPIIAEKVNQQLSAAD